MSTNRYGSAWKNNTDRVGVPTVQLSTADQTMVGWLLVSRLQPRRAGFPVPALAVYGVDVAVGVVCQQARELEVQVQWPMAQ